MNAFLSLHDVKALAVSEYKYKESPFGPGTDYTVMELTVSMTDGSQVKLTCFGTKEGIAFSAPALEQRPCHECGNLMPRDYHPRVTVCSACETDRPSPEGEQAPSPQELARLARGHMDALGH